MKAMMMAAAVLIGTGAALAQDNGAPGTDVCPHGAADTMLQIAAQAPGISDETQLQNAFAFAKQLPVLCPSDAAVHYFAANTLLVISDLVSDPQSKLERLSEAIAALHDFDAATAGQPSTYESALMDETGTPLSIDLKAGATDLLADYLAPKVVFYEANGLFHAWISTAGQAAEYGQSCPYAHQAYAVAEARGHYKGHSEVAPILLDSGGNPNPLGSIRRIEHLISVCPEQAHSLTFQLARLYVLFARISTGRESDVENGYIPLARETLETYLSLSEGTPEAESSRHGVALRWKIEMLELALKTRN